MRRFWILLAFCGLSGCRAAPGAEVSTADYEASGAASPVEGAARGFPSLRHLDGRALGDGEFIQWIENGRLHIRISYDLGSNHRVEENAVLRQEPRLLQEEWSWREMKDGEVRRRYRVDFASGTATAEKLDEGKLKRWSERVDILPGRTFAGFGFSLAIKRLRERLLQGEKIELRGVGFTPKPRVGTVELSYGGLDRMSMGGRTLQGERFVMRPKVPFPASLVMKVPDTRIWFVPPAPAGFLRSEAPFAEPGDPVLRVDLLPGAESGSAEPVTP